MRTAIFIIGIVGFLTILIYEKIFVQGPVARCLKQHFGKTRMSTFFGKLEDSEQSEEDSVLLERIV